MGCPGARSLYPILFPGVTSFRGVSLPLGISLVRISGWGANGSRRKTPRLTWHSSGYLWKSLPGTLLITYLSCEQLATSTMRLQDSKHEIADLQPTKLGELVGGKLRWPALLYFSRGTRSIRRLTQKVLIYAKPILASPSPNPLLIPWRVPGN